MTGMRMATPLLALARGLQRRCRGVAGAVCAPQVFLALLGALRDRHRPQAPVGIAVVMACAGAGLSLIFPVFSVMCLSALMTGGATAWPSLRLQRHVGRAAHDTTQLRQVFSWLAIGPAVSNFIGPFLQG